MSIGDIYLSSAISRLRDYKQLADKTISQLRDEDLFFSPGAESNSIAVIVQHLAGNMQSRWTNFLTEDGEKTWRNRDEEFEQYPHSRTELLSTWEQGWSVLFDSLDKLGEGDLQKNVLIRNESHSVIDAINRQIAHYSGHVGQIVYIGRWILGANWKSLSIPKGGSAEFNKGKGL